MSAVATRSRIAIPNKGAVGTSWLAALVLCSGAGLLICAVANALSRAMLAPSPLIYWAGLLLIALPIFYRLTGRQASPGERLALVCLLGLSLYGAKVVRDAPLFTFSDELVHAFNANQIVSRHHLFHANPIIPVTPDYPGLEGATSALMSITGLSSYGAGIIVVGAARLTLVAAMFLLFGRLSGSARTAGLGVAIYTGNFNFIFWGAQYSYESLALPLLVVVLMTLAEREASPPSWARKWAVPIVLGTAAIVVTHHLTSYALVVFLAALSLSYWVLRRAWGWANPWRFAVVAALFAAGWLLLAAGSTVGYLSPVLSEAIESVFHTASGEAPPRGLFEGKGPVTAATPIGARAVALLAVALLAAGFPLALVRVWRRYRRQPFVLLLALAALAFFGTLALRLAPAAWETGNRASEFLFIGLAFVLACAGYESWRPRGRSWLGRTLLTGGLGIVLVGGAISGWPWDAQLARPLRVKAESRTIVSPPLGMAEWAGRNIDGGRFAAPVADARMLLVPGDHIAIAGQSPDVVDIVEKPLLEGWELPLLHKHHLRYVVVDRRPTSGDGTRGYFFSPNGSPGEGEYLPTSTVTKFAQLPGVARIYSNGAISVFDLGGHR